METELFTTSLPLDWAAARSAVAAYRSSGREACVVDAPERTEDEGPEDSSQPALIEAAAWFEPPRPFCFERPFITLQSAGSLLKG